LRSSQSETLGGQRTSNLSPTRLVQGETQFLCEVLPGGKSEICIMVAFEYRVQRGVLYLTGFTPVLSGRVSWEHLKGEACCVSTTSCRGTGGTA
jgi:hypothetical protein